MKLSIIIPVFNEEKTIEEIIRRVKKAKLPKGVKKEIILVDDGSTDFCSQILKNIGTVRVFRHKVNRGKGTAVRTGLKKATGSIVLIQDADLEYNPNDYSRLIKPILQKKTKVVYGTRLKNYPIRIIGKNNTPFLTHYVGNKFLTLVTNTLYGNGLTDMETCYKVFHKSVLRGIKLSAKRFEFEPEITAKILKRGYKIYEVPIKVKPRGYDEGKKISWRDGFIALWTLIKYKYFD